MMTVNKEILLHPDFITDLAGGLCEMLEALIDAEFEKGDETDFDFIDECADAINAIRSGSAAQILPLISRRDFLKRLGIKTENKFKIAVAACAAAAVIFAAGLQIEVEENVSAVHALSGIVSEFFKTNHRVETTEAQPETTKHQATAAEETVEIIGISVETTPEFKAEYYVGEEFSGKGIKVFAEYNNGERKLVQSKGYMLTVSRDFGTQPKYETVTVSANGFVQTLEVRVIESVSTRKLTSVYALFPDNFDFTAEDLDSIDLSGMQVFAVYSDGGERELSADEYTLERERGKSLFEKNVTITVKHEGCSCSFTVYEN